LSRIGRSEPGLLKARKAKSGSAEKCLALQFLFGLAGFILALQRQSRLGQFYLALGNIFGFIRNYCNK